MPLDPSLLSFLLPHGLTSLVDWAAISARRALLRRRAELGREFADVDAKLADLEVDVNVGADEAVHSTHRLPPDAKNADAFNRACRTGRVHRARKVGRVWVCARDAWDSRAPAPRPDVEPKTHRAKRLPRREAIKVERSAVGDDLLAELGAARRRSA